MDLGAPSPSGAIQFQRRSVGPLVHDFSCDLLRLSYRSCSLSPGPNPMRNEGGGDSVSTGGKGGRWAHKNSGFAEGERKSFQAPLFRGGGEVLYVFLRSMCCRKACRKRAQKCVVCTAWVFFNERTTYETLEGWLSLPESRIPLPAQYTGINRMQTPSR